MDYKIIIELDHEDLPDEVEDREELYEFMFAECQNYFGDFYLKVERA